jgi:hypothetical protein
VPFGIVLGVLLAAGWFIVELRRSGKETAMPVHPGFFMPPPGWAPASGDAAAELAKQLVKLTEIIVGLTTNEDGEREWRGPPARARSPDTDDRGPPEGEPAVPVDLARSASSTPGVEARPETDEIAPVWWLAAVPDLDPEPEPEPKPEPEPDPRAEIVARLHELDRQRQAVRSWMDAEEASGPGWPSEEEVARFQADAVSEIPDPGLRPADGGPGGTDS